MGMLIASPDSLKHYRDGWELRFVTGSDFPFEDAGVFLDRRLEEENLSSEEFKSAFRLWLPVHSKLRNHRDVLDKGMRWLQRIPAADPDRAAITAEFAYFRYFATCKLTQEQDLSQLIKITEALSVHPQSELVYSLALNRLGRTYFDLNRYEEGLNSLKEAETKFAKWDYKLLLSENLQIQGILLDALEDFSGASQAYQASSFVLDQLEIKQLGTLASNAYYLGKLYTERLGNPGLGISFFQEAVKYDLLDDRADKSYLGEDYKALSEAYLQLGDLSMAERFARQSITQYIKIGRDSTSHAASAFLQLAEVKAEKKEWLAAIDQTERAIANYETMEYAGADHRRDKALAYRKLAGFYQKSGLANSSERAYLKVEEIGRDLKAVAFVQDAYRGIIDLSMEQEDGEKAGRYWDLLDDIYAGKFKETSYFRLNHELDWIRINLLNSEKQGDIARKLDMVLGETGTRKCFEKLAWKALSLRNDWYEENGVDDHELEEHLAEIQNRIVNLQANPTRLPHPVMPKEEFRGLIEGALHLCYQQHQRQPDRLWLDYAFQLIEINKQIQLTAGLQHASGPASKLIPEELRKLEEKLTLQLNEVRYKIHRTQTSWDEERLPSGLNPLYRKDDSLQIRLDSVRQIILTNYSAQFRVQNPIPDGSLGKIQAGFGKNTLGLSYFWGERAVYVFSMSRKEAGFTRFDDPTRLQNELVSFLSRIRSKRSHGVIPELKAEKILPDWEGDFSRLVIIPDGILNLMPFEALKRNDKWLLEEFNVTYALSLAPEEIRFKVDFPRYGWKGFAPTYAGTDMIGNRQEVETVHQVTGGDYILAGQADKNRFLQEGQRASLLHLAVYGELDTHTPNYSKLWFGDREEDALTAMEIYGMSLKADLAVLSACETGQDAGKAGDGLMSFARAFSFAGVKSTLFNMWDVPDQESATIMKTFYKYLRDGDSKDLALRKAKLDFLEEVQDSSLKHPYFWAGLILAGDVAPIDNGNHQIGMFWFILGFSVFGGVAFTLLWLYFKSANTKTV